LNKYREIYVYGYVSSPKCKTYSQLAFESLPSLRAFGNNSNKSKLGSQSKSRLNFGNACYHSVQSVMCSHLVPRNLKIKIYKTIILHVVLYGCETFTLTVRDVHRLRVFENRLLRRVIGPKREEVVGEWTRLLNEKLHNLYTSPDIIRVKKQGV
jgi:hypothetical protein